MDGLDELTFMKLTSLHIIFFWCFCLLCFSLSAQSKLNKYANGFQTRAIPLKSGMLTPDENIHEFIQHPFTISTDLVLGNYYLLLQFKQLPTSRERKTIAQSGIQLLEYLGSQTYIASLPYRFDLPILAALGVCCVSPLNIEMKLAPNLRDAGSLAKKHSLNEKRILVNYHNNLRKEFVLHELEQLGYEVLSSRSDATWVTIIVNSDELEVVARLPFVQYLELAPTPPKPESKKGQNLHRANTLYANGLNNSKYNGNGVQIAIGDDGIVGSHIDFKGRLEQSATNFDGGEHGDMVAGILLGAGNLNPSAQGMGYGADLYVLDNWEAVYQAQDLHNDYDVILTSTSYADGCNAGYTSFTQLADKQTRQTPTLLHIFSAGNRGYDDCGYGAGSGWGNITGGVKLGKNVLAIGNVNEEDELYFTSSRGPSTDGRIKPDLVAMGENHLSTASANGYQIGNGTSAAAPTVAGIAAQLYQAYREWTGGYNPQAALVKACLLNTAEDLGHPGPDFKHGWGRVNAFRAVKVLEENRFIREVIDQGDTQNHALAIPPNVQALRVMLYWTDFEGAVNSNSLLVNDLGLKLTSPTGDTHLPLVLDGSPDPISLDSPALPGIDTLNNVEQVVIENPLAGNYSIEVAGSAIAMGPQTYYLVYEFFFDEIVVTYPSKNAALQPNEMTKIHWDTYGNQGTFFLSYSLDGGITQIPLDTIAGDLRQYDWFVPDTVTSEAFIYINRNGTPTGQNQTAFCIVDLVENLAVAKTCPDSLFLAWDSVLGASAYQVFRLGDYYMDSVGITNQTTFAFAGLYPPNENWFSVAPILANGLVGQRCLAIPSTGGLVNCSLENDVRVEEVLSPEPQSYADCFNYDFPVSILLRNEGLNTQTAIPVFYQVDSQPIVSELFTGTLLPSSSAIHTFAASINISGNGGINLKVWTGLPNDEAMFNDTLFLPLEVETTPLYTLPYSHNFQVQKDCGREANCSLEECALLEGWKNQPNGLVDEIDWRVTRGPTPSGDTGPALAHSPPSLQGKYLYLEPSSGCVAQAAEMTSPCFDLSSVLAPELSFWYHLYGNNMGELHLDVFDGNSWFLDVMPMLSGNLGNTWQQALLDLSSFSGQTIQLRFRGITGNGYASDLAIDDVVIYDKMAAPVPAFLAATEETCPGVAVPFTDLSQNAPTTWLWAFMPNTVSFANGTTESDANPQVIFNNLGTYEVSLTASNSNGWATLVRTDFIRVTEGVSLNVQEDFEDFVFPPLGWSVHNPDVQLTWQSGIVLGSNGNASSVAFMNNYAYNEIQQEDALTTLKIDLSNTIAPKAAFDIAYVRYSASFYDALRIEVSKDCGLTFPDTIYLKENQVLATAADNQQSWVPTAEEWRRDTIDLAAYQGETISLRFINRTGNGNNLFLDNFLVFEELLQGNSNAPLEEKLLSLYPNPNSGIFWVEILPPLSFHSLSLVNLQGTSIWETTFIIPKQCHQVNLNRLPSGIYFLKVNLGNDFALKRILRI